MTRKSSNNYDVSQEFSPIYNESTSEITAFIFSNKSASVDREKLKFFFGNISTDFEGNASKIVTEVISTYTRTEVGRSAIENGLVTSLSEFKYGSNRVFKLRSS